MVSSSIIPNFGISLQFCIRNWSWLHIKQNFKVTFFNETNIKIFATFFHHNLSIERRNIEPIFIIFKHIMVSSSIISKTRAKLELHIRDLPRLLFEQNFQVIFFGETKTKMFVTFFYRILSIKGCTFRLWPTCA